MIKHLCLCLLAHCTNGTAWVEVVCKGQYRATHLGSNTSQFIKTRRKLHILTILKV